MHDDIENTSINENNQITQMNLMGRNELKGDAAVSPRSAKLNLYSPLVLSFLYKCNHGGGGAAARTHSLLKSNFK